MHDGGKQHVGSTIAFTVQDEEGPKEHTLSDGPNRSLSRADESLKGKRGGKGGKERGSGKEKSTGNNGQVVHHTDGWTTKRWPPLFRYRRILVGAKLCVPSCRNRKSSVTQSTALDRHLPLGSPSSKPNGARAYVRKAWRLARRRSSLHPIRYKRGSVVEV